MRNKIWLVLLLVLMMVGCAGNAYKNACTIDNVKITVYTNQTDLQDACARIGAYPLQISALAPSNSVSYLGGCVDITNHRVYVLPIDHLIGHEVEHILLKECI